MSDPSSKLAANSAGMELMWLLIICRTPIFRWMEVSRPRLSGFFRQDLTKPCCKTTGASAHGMTHACALALCNAWSSGTGFKPQGIKNGKKKLRNSRGGWFLSRLTLRVWSFLFSISSTVQDLDCCACPSSQSHRPKWASAAKKNAPRYTGAFRINAR